MVSSVHVVGIAGLLGGRCRAKKAKTWHAHPTTDVQHKVF